MKAKDIMTTPVVSVGPETAVHDIAKLLVDHRISTVPVIDDGQNLVGIVSEGDLMFRAEVGTERYRSWWLRFFSSMESLATEYAKTYGLKARDLMTRTPQTVGEDTSLADVARVLESLHIKRVPVVRDGRVVGIVSRANLVQALASGQGKSQTAADLDNLIRNNVTTTLAGQPWKTLLPRNVIVTDGVAHLWGFINSEEERIATRVAVERVPGVKGIEDHMIIRPLVLMDD